MSNDDKVFLFKRGDLWELPRKEAPAHSIVYGFEINMSPDRKIEDCYFVTRGAYTLLEIEFCNWSVYKKVLQAKIDQDTGKGSAIFKLMKPQKLI